MKLDTLNVNEILNILYTSQLAGVESLKENIKDIEDIISNILPKLQNGGRLIFAGAGTSGRLATQESSELFPTFSWPKKRSICLIAGGKKALKQAQEGAEDNTKAAEDDFNKIRSNKNDIVICISASGETPYTLTILKLANEIGAYTVGISSNKNSTLLNQSKGKIFQRVGEEAIQGSTRMASGTSQKIALNMLTTTLMIRLNRVYDSFMVDLAITNKKLEKRGIEIISKICDVNQKIASQALFECNNEVKLSCVYLKTGNIELARKKLKEHDYNLRSCLE